MCRSAPKSLDCIEHEVHYFRYLCHQYHLVQNCIFLCCWCFQVFDARAASENLQLLLKNVAERKKQKQVQSQGLVILAAIYGDIEAYEKGVSGIQYTAHSTGNGIADLPPYLDVTIPLQFLVDDSGQLRVWIIQFSGLQNI